MKIENILFDMGFTLIGIDNFSIKEYSKTLSSNVRYLQSYLINKKIISTEDFGTILKNNQKQYFLKSFLTDTEYSMEFILNKSFIQIGMNPKDITKELIGESAKILFSKDLGNWKVHSDVEPTLKILKNEGFKLAIVSNAPYHEGVLQMLELNNISKYFDTIVSSALAKIRKPKQDIFRLAFLNLGADSSSSIFIGDDLYADIYGAQTLGMKTIYFDKGFELPSPKKIKVIPDAKVKKISEIIPIIEDWRKSP